MKIFQSQFIILLFAVFVFSPPGISQDSPGQALTFEVNRVYPPISLTKEALKAARTLEDLNPYYKPSWIRKYIAVEVLASWQGKQKKALGENGQLNPAQKALMVGADTGTEIFVRVDYIPENTLVNNEPKEISFSFVVNPENDAEYSGGQSQLTQYLKEKVIENIPDGSFQGYDLAAIKFTINEEGEIVDAHVFWSSKKEAIDEMLLETVRLMPCWKPAEYDDGLKVKQEFVLTVGNMENCALNLLNIRRE